MNPSSFNSSFNSSFDRSFNSSFSSSDDGFCDSPHDGPHHNPQGRSFEETAGDLPSRRGPFLSGARPGAVEVFGSTLGPPHALMLERPALCVDPDSRSGDEAVRIRADGARWDLSTEGQAALHARVPVEQAAWTRRLVFAEMPDAQDWRWLPAYVQRCPNLVEIVLPGGSERVVPDLRTHGDRTPDGRWLLRIARREDGVGGHDLLCAALRLTLGDSVRRPQVLGAMGRPPLFERLARDVEAIRAAAPPDPALGDRIAALVRAIVDDDQIAIHCALIAKEHRTPPDRLAAMEEMVAELQRAPLVTLQSPRVEGLSFGSSHVAVGLIVRMNATHARPRGRAAHGRIGNDEASRPTSLTATERWTAVEFLNRVPASVMTATMRFVRDCALRILRADRAFADTVFLSFAEEDVLIDALHLALQPECRVIGNPWLERARLEALPPEVRAALAALTDWVASATGMDGLRRERWHWHILSQTHWHTRERTPVPGLLRGKPGEPDLDAPPSPPIATIATFWGRALWLDLHWLGEPVTSAAAVNRVLAERFAFGLGIRRARLVGDRIPERLRWEDAERVEIHLTEQEFTCPDRLLYIQAIRQAVAADLPNAIACQFCCPTRDVTVVMDTFVTLERATGDKRVDDIGGRLPGVLWNGRQRNRLRTQAAFRDWLHGLYALSDRSNAGPPLAAWVAPVLLRVIEDEAFAARGADQILQQDGGCVDAYRRSLYRLVVLSHGGLTGDAHTAVLAAFQLACMLRADGAAQAADPEYHENLEDALLLRVAVAQRLRDRLGDDVQVLEDVSFGHLGREGTRWNDASGRAARSRRADAIIEAEIASGFATSFDCLDPDGLIGDLLTRRLDQEIGNAALEEGLRAEARARYEHASAQAGDDAVAQQAADDAMTRDLDGLGASLQARRRQHLDGAIRTLKDRLSATRPTDTLPPAI